MKLAIISDIHANLEALEAVWADALRLGAERFICLGDTVGYGPDPQEVVSRLALSHTLTVRGNHEQAMSDPALLQRMSHEARVTLRHTSHIISPATRLWLSTLPKSHAELGARFVHGAPPQSVLRYFTQCKGRELKRRFSLYTESVCFTGHTHLQTITRERNGKILSSLLFEGRHQLPPHFRYVIGVGSVGQPRGEGRDAEYVLWTPESNEIQARRVPYNKAATIRKLEVGNFPATLIARL
ncbi:metallophosphatase family protein [Desulfovibrio sp. OttesenSCG-928-I05]|nr:metallophosphatase family protein [Desulfovibrio sp. OttesenSCG-928-I05]